MRDAGLVAFYLPMHTATRLALPVIERVKRSNPARAPGLLRLIRAAERGLLRGLGVETILGGEFEAALVDLARGEVRQLKSHSTDWSS